MLIVIIEQQQQQQQHILPYITAVYFYVYDVQNLVHVSKSSVMSFLDKSFCYKYTKLNNVENSIFPFNYFPIVNLIA